MAVPLEPHCLLNVTHWCNDKVVFGLKSCFISLSFSGPNYFNTNIRCMKCLYLWYIICVVNTSTSDLSGILFLEFIYTKSYFFRDCISWQPSPPRNLLLNLFNFRFSLKYFEFILDWVDTYFKRPLSFCCMAGRVQAENCLIIDFHHKVLAGRFI